MERVLELLQKRPWRRKCLRTNIANPEDIRVGKTGFKVALLECNKLDPSERVLREAIKEIAPVWDGYEVMVNRNVTCRPHKDGGNVGQSYCLWLGDFEGGALVFEGGRRIEEKEIWHTLNGQELHWNEPHTGDKYSVVLYKPGRPSKGRCIVAAKLKRAPAAPLSESKEGSPKAAMAWYADWQHRRDDMVAQGLPARVLGVEALPPWNGHQLIAVTFDINEIHLPRSHADRGFELHLSLIFDHELDVELWEAARRAHMRWAGRDVVLRVSWMGSGGAAFLSDDDPIAQDADIRQLHRAGSYTGRDMHISL